MIKKIIKAIRELIRGKIESISVFHNPEDAAIANNFRDVLRRTYGDNVPTRLVTVRKYTLNGKSYTLERSTMLVSYIFPGSFLSRKIVITDLLKHTSVKTGIVTSTIK